MDLEDRRYNRRILSGSVWFFDGCETHCDSDADCQWPHRTSTCRWLASFTCPPPSITPLASSHSQASCSSRHPRLIPIFFVLFYRGMCSFTTHLLVFWITSAICAICLAQQNAQMNTPFMPPSWPLAVKGPYLNSWQAGGKDGTLLPMSSPAFWPAWDDVSSC